MLGTIDGLSSSANGPPSLTPDRPAHAVPLYRGMNAMSAPVVRPPPPPEPSRSEVAPRRSCAFASVQPLQTLGCLLDSLTDSGYDSLLREDAFMKAPLSHPMLRVALDEAPAAKGVPFHASPSPWARCSPEVSYRQNHRGAAAMPPPAGTGKLEKQHVGRDGGSDLAAVPALQGTEVETAAFDHGWTACPRSVILRWLDGQENDEREHQPLSSSSDAVLDHAVCSALWNGISCSASCAVTSLEGDEELQAAADAVTADVIRVVREAAVAVEARVKLGARFLKPARPRAA